MAIFKVSEQLAGSEKDYALEDSYVYEANSTKEAAELYVSQLDTDGSMAKMRDDVKVFVSDSREYVECFVVECRTSYKVKS